MKIRIISLFLLAILFAFSCVVQNPSEREINFNNDWKFIRADVTGAEQPGYDDATWRMLDLPHDYSIEDLPAKEGVKQIGPFSEKSAGGASTGHVMGGTAWYRKHFKLEKADEEKLIQVLLDGVYMNADVWINGHHLGNHPYGYTAFAFDLTPHLNPAGQENVLAVQVKNEGKNSRWYSGSGIYRDVNLIKTGKVNIPIWGVKVTTPEVSNEKATVKLEINIANPEKKSGKLVVSTTLKSPVNQAEIKAVTTIDQFSGESVTAEQKFEIAQPTLWSPETPELYEAVTEVSFDGKIIDNQTTVFGIRSVEFSAEKGFLLNGKPVELKGGCMHHDNGALGSATFTSAEYRRVKTMKENGFNAIRTSHNPPSKTFLDACDKLGMLVLDEAFDQWQKPKNAQDYNLYFDQWCEKDIEAMVKRDRNHPSVIIWSVGNEIQERGDSAGLAIFRKLREKVLEFDKSRPVTQAICEFWDNPGKGWDYTEKAFAQMDVHGYNYQWKRYETDHEKFPERIMIGTESVPKEAFENWQQVEKQTYVIGDFVWTGMDHLGESGIGNAKLDNDTTKFLPPWPWFVNNSGDISLLGNKKPQMYYRDVVWRNSNLEILVHSPIPAGRKEVVSFWGWPDEMKSWNWEGNEGTPLLVSVYSRCDEVRLELNGEVIGTKKVSEESKLTAHFEVPYQPGELVAVGLKEGKEIIRQTLKTTDKPAQLKISVEQNAFPGIESDLVYFNIEVLDKDGLLVPNAHIPVEFEIKGGGKLQAVANENPKDMHSFQQPQVNSYRGKCQLIVRKDKTGSEIKVTAKSDGLKSASI
jgi:beta-galactosidase